MVTSGQFLERPAIIAVRKQVLEGLSHRGTLSPPLLIIPPPPEEGSFDHVLAAELAWASARAGHPELRFNFRGVGASQGRRSRNDVSRRVDAGAALRLLCENTSMTSVAVAALCGSAGVGLALQKADKRIRALALIAPGRLELNQLREIAVPLLVVLSREARADFASVALAVHQAGGTVEVMDGLDASFTQGLPQVGRTVAAWLSGL